MSALAAEHQSINLAQGFPDTDGTRDILQAPADALIDGRNQYPPMPGVPELRMAVAAHNRRFYGLEVDGMS
ncbi:MAG: aminotransferase, partial [Acetobacteraceae bacterium]|nr:aminotransferase [Acetobacteraceae bacterium]